MAGAEEEAEARDLVRRILKDIGNAFRKNPAIDEIGVIPVSEARYNRSPVVLVGSKLGLESWCIKLLVPHVHGQLVHFRQRKIWPDQDGLAELTHTLLLLNPDCTTAWNVRKELIAANLLEPRKDLRLGSLALTKFPKSPETWIHRRWVLQRLLNSQERARASADDGDEFAAARAEAVWHLVQGEMSVCRAAAERYPSNYNAWSHRIWVLQNVARCSVKALLTELAATEPWVRTHVSDHSGFHYRQFLLNSLAAAATSSAGDPTRVSPLSETAQQDGEGPGAALAESGPQSDTVALTTLLHREFDLCTDLILAYPGHETLWSHRRFLYHLWHRNDGKGGSSSPSGTRVPDKTRGAQHEGTGSHSENAKDGAGDGSGSVANGGSPSASHTRGRANGQGSKRLKAEPRPYSLQDEASFAARALAESPGSLQARSAAAYTRWLESVGEQ
ncbi:protein prenyltransferase alpha subunit repeat-containing protein 1 isoform X1 [Lampetra fluviatilis]